MCQAARQASTDKNNLPKKEQFTVFSWSVLDCEQSLFSSKIRGKERKTRKHASVTVSVTPNAHATSGSRHRRSQVTLTVTLAGYLFCVLSHGFSRKRETAGSLGLFTMSDYKALDINIEV